MHSAVHDKVDRIRERYQRHRHGKYGLLWGWGTLIIGWVVFLAGIVMIPLPGQGWLVTFLGIGILALEQKWAVHALDRGIALYERWLAWYRKQSLGMKGTVWVGVCAVVLAATGGVAYLTYASGHADYLNIVAARIGIEL